MAISFTVFDVFPATAAELYTAWMDSEEHTDMTGGEADIGPEEGDTFEAWDGYISGVTVMLDPNRRIVQQWRTTEFDDDAPDSELEITFEVEGENLTRVTLRHTNLPADGMKYKQGWVDNYFEPMKAYFGED